MALKGLLFIAAAAVNFLVIGTLLPDRPITQAQFQSYAASAAYLKSTTQALAVGLVFMLSPYTLIRSLENLLASGKANTVTRFLSGDRSALPSGIIFVPSRVLVGIFVLIVLTAVALMGQLLDNLVHNSFTWLFQQLLWSRMTVFFLLGLGTLWWYSAALSDLKRHTLEESMRQRPAAS